MKTTIYTVTTYYNNTPSTEYYMSLESAEKDLISKGFVASANIKTDVANNERGLWTKINNIQIFANDAKIIEAWIGFIFANN